MAPANFTAHQDNYLQHLLQTKQDKDWGICGVELISTDAKLSQFILTKLL